MPGRIYGMTTDSKGERLVLTFQAHEQHIRRERATSNNTTNVALMAVAATIYLSIKGRDGLWGALTFILNVIDSESLIVYHNNMIPCHGKR